MARYTREELMHRAQIASGELGLSSWTQADRKRLSYLEQALVALDEEQSLTKEGIEELLEAHEGELPTEVADKLRALLSKDKPRVKYPDRALVDDQVVAAWDRGYEAAIQNVGSGRPPNPYRKS